MPAQSISPSISFHLALLMPGMKNRHAASRAGMEISMTMPRGPSIKGVAIQMRMVKAKTKSVAYDRLKIWVNKDKKLPTKIECLTEANMLIKTLYFKDTKDFGGGIVRPAVIETDSPLYKGYKSVIIMAGVKKRTFKDEVFTLTFMPNLESLR